MLAERRASPRVAVNEVARFERAGRGPMGPGVRFHSMDRATRNRIDDVPGRPGGG